jgi:hypothetical protein
MKTREKGVKVLFCESAAATDANGNYSFYITGSRRHFLTVDRHQIGDNMIPNIKMPMPIELVAGEEKVVDIGVVRGSVVRGHVAVCRPRGQKGDFPLEENGKGEEEPLERVSGLANILVEISSGNEIRRLLTNQQGEFVFD